MKNKSSLVFAIISILVLIFFGYEIYSGYIANHTYYSDMLNSGDNWKGVIFGLLFSLIPVGYLVLSKQKSMMYFIISVFVGLFLFGGSLVAIKDDVLGGGLVMLFLNFLIVFALGIFFISGVLVLGSLLKKSIFKFENKTVFDVFINFGIGLSAFNILNFVLILTNTFYSIISWILLLGLGVLLFFQFNTFKEIITIVSTVFKDLTVKNINKRRFLIVPVILIAFSLMYYYFGFFNSYIPYPTAWDANHAYMFFPKMIAYNHGIYWNEQGMWGGTDLWTPYIAFWFNLFYPLENSFWISADTMAVEMNFLSGIFVLLFGLALIKEVLEYFNISVYGTINEETTETAFYVGWFMLLIWLTSGMGAFLVFVDNKTDLGIMTLIILGIYSGFIFLRKVKEEEDAETSAVNNAGSALNLSKSTISYLIISGYLYAVAVASKATALFDVVKFSMFLSWTWIGIFGILAIFLLIVGLLGLARFKGMDQYLSYEGGKYVLLLGILSGAAGIIKSFMKKQVKYLTYVLIWGLVFVVTTIIIKGPFSITTYLKTTQSVKPFELVQKIFLGYNQSKEVSSSTPRLLLASTSNTPAIEKALKEVVQNTGSSLSGQTTATNSGATINQLKVQSCSLPAVSVSNTGDLYKTTQKAQGDNFNEDVGRYIGFGWREFTNPWWKVFIPASNGCISFNKNAEILCNNSSVISSLDANKLKSILATMDKNSSGYQLLSDLVNNPNQSEDRINAIQSFYQDNAIKVDNGKVSVPFKFLAPFNVSFNWSLQNLSSYYTDIGYMWLISLFLVVVGLIYAIVIWDRFLLGISMVTLIGWLLWSIIGGGIVWYDIGLIVWTILGITVFFHRLSKNKESSIAFSILLGIFVLFGLYQLLLNFIRISSQGGSGPFVWYKESNGKVYQIDSGLSNQETIKSPYNWKEVFELQFAHYDKFINLANNRGANDGIFLAGTYARYFIKNQNKIVYDQFLNWLWEIFSDSDACKSYLRLKDKNIKYITIDPNIGTVVMGQGNKSLFDRFFAKINEKDSSVQTDGVISMLARLYENGYVNYVSSNNIGAIYAFRLSDEELRKFIPKQVSNEELTIIRASMTVARYPDIQNLTQKYFDNQQGIMILIMNILDTRIRNGQFVFDLADIYGKQIDETKMNRIINLLVSAKTVTNEVVNEINNLSSDEKMVFLQFVNLYYLKDKQPQDYSKTLQSILMNSIGSSSQIIVLEVK